MAVELSRAQRSSFMSHGFDRPDCLGIPIGGDVIATINDLRVKEGDHLLYFGGGEQMRLQAVGCGPTVPAFEVCMARFGGGDFNTANRVKG